MGNCWLHGSVVFGGRPSWTREGGAGQHSLSWVVVTLVVLLLVATIKKGKKTKSDPKLKDVHAMSNILRQEVHTKRYSTAILTSSDGWLAVDDAEEFVAFPQWTQLWFTNFMKSRAGTRPNKRTKVDSRCM